MAQTDGPSLEQIAEHKWIRNDPRWPSATKDLTCCERCGVVQRADGKNRTCRGVLPKITTRESEVRGQQQEKEKS
jgi:hypothetical protein